MGVIIGLIVVGIGVVGVYYGINVIAAGIFMIASFFGIKKVKG